jgi:hypothetical protein
MKDLDNEMLFNAGHLQPYKLGKLIKKLTFIDAVQIFWKKHLKYIF